VNDVLSTWKLNNLNTTYHMSCAAKLSKHDKTPVGGLPNHAVCNVCTLAQWKSKRQEVERGEYAVQSAHTSTGWVKKSIPPQKALSNILACAKPFWAKFCSVIRQFISTRVQNLGSLRQNLMNWGSIFHKYPNFYSFWF